MSSAPSGYQDGARIPPEDFFAPYPSSERIFPICFRRNFSPNMATPRGGLLPVSEDHAARFRGQLPDVRVPSRVPPIGLRLRSSHVTVRRLKGLKPARCLETGRPIYCELSHGAVHCHRFRTGRREPILEKRGSGVWAKGI